MTTEIRSPIGSLKATPGGALVLLGFVTIYAITGIGFGSREREPTLVDYLAIGFGFFIALAGIVLLFRGLGRTSDADTEAGYVSSSDIEHAVAQLGKNYDILRKQATQGFVLAGTFMALGILVILAGSLGEMFGFTKTAGNLTTVAGLVVEAVSGLGLYLFNATFKRLNTSSDRLHEMWKLLAAFRKAEDLPEEAKTEMIVRLIAKPVDSDSGRGEGSARHSLESA